MSPLEVVFQRDKAYGVRNTGGYICFMRKVSCYPGQDERYKTEIKESNDFAELFANAPETKQQRDELLEALKQTQRLADKALRRDEVFRGKALNEIGNVAEQAIKNAKA